jgi:antitoxin VapB
MALNLKNAELEKLASEVANLAHESKTEAVRRALSERKSRLQAHGMGLQSGENLRQYLEKSVWPLIPPNKLGRPVTRQEEDQILGYGPEGF